jgi:hypothetical protein
MKLSFWSPPSPWSRSYWTAVHTSQAPKMETIHEKFSMSCAPSRMNAPRRGEFFTLHPVVSVRGEGDVGHVVSFGVRSG